MLEAKLKVAKHKRKYLLLAFCISSIFIFLSVICSFVFKFFLDSFLVQFILIILDIILLLCFMSSLSNLEKNKKEIDAILFRQSLPTKYRDDVIVKTNSLMDINIKFNAKKLRIRYFENRDAIECKYKFNGKKYHIFLTIEFAQKLFDCDFL